MAAKVVSLGIVALLFGLICVGFGPDPANAAADKDGPKVLDTDPNLAAWWKFDETSGATAADSSRYRRKGVLKGGLSFDKNSAPGRTGRALTFDGNDDYVEITGYKGVAGTQPRTVTAWVKTTKAIGEVISWGEEDFGQMWTFAFIRKRMGVTPSGGYFYMNDEISDDQWHHVAAVVEEAELPNLHDDVTLYKNGTIAEIHDIGLLDLWPISTGSDLDVRIGREFRGLIDDIRIYDRALSRDEIKLLFESAGSSPSSKSK